MSCTTFQIVMLLPLPLILVCFLSSHSLHFLYIIPLPLVPINQCLFSISPSLPHTHFPHLSFLFLLQFSCTLPQFSSSSLLSISVANKMKEGIKDRCDAAFNKTVSGSCGLDQQFSSVIRLEEDSGPHTSMIQDTRTKKSDMQRSTGRVQRYVHEKLTSYMLFDPSISSIFPDEVLSSRSNCGGSKTLSCQSQNLPSSGTFW